MKNHAPQVDAYIAKAPEYARPILQKIRKLFHKACPEIEETIKWGVPHFDFKGIVGSMAAFKQHVGFAFWKGGLLSDPHQLFSGVGHTSMSALKICALKDLPAEKILLAYIREAVALNEQGVKIPREESTVKKELTIPEDLRAALTKNKKAQATFEGFSYSHKKDYVEWITEAKQEATRQKRLATTIEWLAEGKPRNWKYMKC